MSLPLTGFWKELRAFGLLLLDEAVAQTRQVVTVRVTVGGTGFECPQIEGAIPILCVVGKPPQTVIPATE